MLGQPHSRALRGAWTVAVTIAADMSSAGQCRGQCRTRELRAQAGRRESAAASGDLGKQDPARGPLLDRIRGPGGMPGLSSDAHWSGCMSLLACLRPRTPLSIREVDRQQHTGGGSWEPVRSMAGTQKSPSPHTPTLGPHTAAPEVFVAPAQ